MSESKFAMQAVMKHTTFPETIALKTNSAKSLPRVGANGNIPPIVMPIEPKFENPHKA